MPSNHSLAFLALLCSTPLTALARRVQPEGSAASFGGPSGSSDPTRPLHFSLDSANATIFAFSLVFAFLTALQAIAAFINIFRRIAPQQQQQQQQQQPPPPPVLDVGHVFPIAFLLSNLMLSATYALRAVFWALIFNEARFSHPPPLQDAYIASWASLAYLTDIFLILCLLALIYHRSRALRTYSGPIHLIKPILDGILIVALLGLSAAYLGSRVSFESQADLEELVDINRAYSVLLFVAALDVVASSVFLWCRAHKQNSFLDRKLAICLTLLVSPMLLLYTLFGIFPREILLKKGPGIGPYFGQALSAGLVLNQEWDLILVIITCITKFVIISMCLKFGVPPRNQLERRVMEPRVVPVYSKY